MITELKSKQQFDIIEFQIGYNAIKSLSIKFNAINLGNFLQIILKYGAFDPQPSIWYTDSQIPHLNQGKYL